MLNINDKVPGKIRRGSEPNFVLTSPSNYSKSYLIEFDGIEYIYGIDEKNIITFISTDDPDFKTTEGFSTKTTYSEIYDRTKGKLIKETGWVFYIPLELGWNAAFMVGDSATLDKPKLTDRVNFFFKRK